MASSGWEKCTYCKREHSVWEPCWDFSTQESRNGLTWEQIIKSLFLGKECQREHPEWEPCLTCHVNKVDSNTPVGEKELLHREAITNMPREIHPDSAPGVVIPEKAVIPEKMVILEEVVIPGEVVIVEEEVTGSASVLTMVMTPTILELDAALEEVDVEF